MMFYVGYLFGKEDLGVTPFFVLVGLSCQVSHGNLNNPVSLMARYSEQGIFLLVNGSSIAL